MMARLTVGNVHRVSDSCVFIEQHNTAHNHPNLLQRFHSVMRLERSKVLEITIGHDGVQSVCDFSHHLKAAKVA